MTKFSTTDLNIIHNSLIKEQDEAKRMQAQASAQLSQRVSDVAKMYPMLPPEVILPGAKAGWNDDQFKMTAQKLAQMSNDDPDRLNPPETVKKNKSFWQRNFVDKVKTASRWTTAAFNFPLEMVQGAGSQFFDKNPGVKGWFASTELGSMVMEDEKSGSGWFVGGKTKENQGRRARQYRGEVGGHAWTIGRGLASVMLPENSTAFNLLSGLIDGGVALYVPTVPGAKGVSAAAKTVRETGAGGKGVQAAAELVARAGREGAKLKPSQMSAEEFNALRTQLTNSTGWVGDTIDLGKFNGFLATSDGRRLVENLRDANTLDDVYKVTNDNLYLDTAKRLRDAKTDGDVMEVLIDTIGTQTGLTRTRLPGTARTFATKKRMMDFLEEVPVLSSRKVRRLASNVPRTRFTLDVADDPIEARNSIKAIGNWARQNLLPDDTWEFNTFDDAGNAIVKQMPGRRQILDRAADVMIGEGATPTAKKAFKAEFNDVLKASLEQSGIPREIVEALWRRQQVISSRNRLYNLNAAGEFTDSGFYMGLVSNNKKYANGILVSPQNAAELADNVVEMPDPRQIRALTSNLSWIYTKSKAGAMRKAAKEARVTGEDLNLARLAEAGQLRLPFAAIDAVQQLWRTSTLMTAAYGVRNLIEGQIRLTFSQSGDVTSLGRHPLQHTMWATKTKGAGDIEGNMWEGVPIGEAASKTQREYDLAVNSAAASYMNDPVANFRMAERTGDWNLARKGFDDKEQVVLGHGDQIGKLNADVVDRLIAAGADDAEIKAILNYAGTAPDARNAALEKFKGTIGKDDVDEWYRNIYDLHINGRQVFIPGDGGRPGYFAPETQSVDLNIERNMDLYLQESRDRVMTMTGGRGELMQIVATGQMPTERIIAAEFGLTRADIDTVVEIPTPSGRGRRFARVVDIDQNGEAVIRPFAFSRGEATGDLKRLLGRDDIYNNPNMPQAYGVESRAPQWADKNSNLRQRWDETVNMFFGHLYNRPAKFLERSVAYRQRYFNWVDELVPSLDQGALDELVDVVTRKAANLQIPPSQYVGDAKRWERILEFQSGQRKSYGTLNLSEANAYAKGLALDDLKVMLYDASERNNLTDIARVVMPFAQAQIDFYKALGRMAFVDTGFGRMPNLYNLRKATQIVDGGISADPDNDGNGFFYRDPNTGQWSFSYPMGDKFLGKLTSLVGGGPGIMANMQAPVGGVLLGFDFRPGLGPVGQFATSAVLPDSPQFDEIRNYLLPFGETAFKGETTGQQVYKSFVPSWAQKVISGLTDTPEGSSIYANTFFETYQALAATGKYDMANPDDLERLRNDAKSKAKVLTVMRGFIQFSGPSRFSPEFEVSTKQGDVLATTLTKEFFDMQNDTAQGGYGTAVQRFIETFGEDAFIYLGRKSRSLIGGLESTEQAGRFQAEHPELFRRYKDVAGFFAPGGGSYSQAAYFRQLQTGAKERISAEESMKQAQRLIGYSYYKTMRDKAGPYPTDEQREYLRKYREFLVKKYPGFGEGDTKTTQERMDQIERLRQAADSLPDNPVSQGIKVYLAKRDEALGQLAQVGLTTLSGKKAESMREYLFQYGEAVAETYPDFGRVWEQLLSYEVDLG